MAQRGPTPRNESLSETVTGFTQGLQQYLDPTLCKPQQWLDSQNVFSGQFGSVQRARTATVVVPGGGVSVNLGVITSFTTGGVTTLIFGTLTPHGFSAGSDVTITGTTCTGIGFPVNFINGTYLIISTTSTSFTVAYPTILSSALTGNGGAATVYSNNYPAQFPFLFNTLKYFALPTASSYLLADVSNGKLFSFDTGNNYKGTQRFNWYLDPQGNGVGQLVGPWSREVLSNIVYEMNGQVKQTGRLANATTIESFGLDAPDVSPQIVITGGSSQNVSSISRSNGTVTATLAGSLTVPGGNGVGMVNVTGVTDISFNGTFSIISGSGTSTLTWAQTGNNTSSSGGAVNFSKTKSVGTSYAYAWENANKAHVGAPSPVSQYIAYSSQYGTIQCIEQGQVTVNSGSTGVTGTGTNFTSAWIGRYLWIQGTQSALGPIVSVLNATNMTLFAPSGVNSGPVAFQIYDPSATHIRLYQTADGGATYFRVQRNVFSPSINTLAGAGLQFFDTANSEPPSFPFTTETSQIYNVPPPVGSFIKEYQGNLIVYGVPGAPQTFFYSNSTLTSIGLQQESFAPLNQVTLPIQNASLNGMAECPGSLIIWSDKQDMFRLTGLLTDNTSATASQQGATISALPYNLGCASPFAVALTPLGVIWLTSNAEVWLYTDRYAPRNIGRPIINVLQSINPAFLKLARATYYHNFNRDWFVLCVPANGASANNLMLILDLEQLASNGSPSYFVFDMATNQPAWYKYNPSCPSVETVYEAGGAVRLLTGAADTITDQDFNSGNFLVSENSVNGFVKLHAWGNDSATTIKRPTWFRFRTNQDPSLLNNQNWSFEVDGIDDDFYNFDAPLSLILTPGVNDASTLGGNPNLIGGSPFRHSPELFKVGGVNFVMGRRLVVTTNFPTSPGAAYNFVQYQIGFGPSPPR